MITNIDMAKIERNTWLIYQQDGIWDISIGAAFLAYGIFIVNDFTSMAVIIPAVFAALVPNIVFLKKKFTQPRLGYVVPGQELKNKEARKKRLLAILGVFSLIAGVINFMAFSGESAWMTSVRNLELIPFGVVLSTGALSIAIIFFIKRFLAYSVIILVVFISGHIADLALPYHFIILGGAFLVIGLIYFIKFVRKYPVVSGEELNETGQR